MSESNSKHKCEINTKYDGYGVAINECYENSSGELWVRNTKHQFGTQVNFCPFCGHKAKSQFTVMHVKSNHRNIGSFISSLNYKYKYIR